MNGIIKCIALVLVMSCSVNRSVNDTKDSSENYFDGNAVGCGNFVVYKMTSDKQEYVSVQFQHSNFELNSTYSIGMDGSPKVVWKVFDGFVGEILCNDIRGMEPKKLSSIGADSGTITLVMSKKSIELASKGLEYPITLILKDVTFGEKLIKKLSIENVNVGWLPG